LETTGKGKVDRVKLEYVKDKGKKTELRKSC
jgi:hypothetical protein